MPKTDFIVTIPSYRRAEKQETLDCMRRLGIPKERIYIFVQTEEDYKDYTRLYGAHANIVRSNATNVTTARNAIIKHFSGSSDMLMMDDDISAIGRLENGKLKKIEDQEEFADAISACFNVARKLKSPLFGIYPVYNDFFMSATISTKVTVNTVIGFVKGTALYFDETYNTKEDIELCARLLSFGGNVARINFLAPQAKHRTNKGGCYETWKSNANEIVVRRLCNAYPTILAPHPRKNSEVRVILPDKKIKVH